MTTAAPGLIGSGKRPSYNYWDTDDAEPMKQAHVRRYKLAAKYARGRVLDVACGWGHGTFILGAKADQVTGYDIDEEAVAFGNQMLEPVEHVSLEVLDLEAWEPLAEPPESWPDWVVTLETVEHLEDPARFVENVKRIARKGVVISIPVKKKANEFHLHHPTVEQMRSWFHGWRCQLETPLTTRVKNKPLQIGTLGVYVR